jgi:hypothetical protein
MRNELPVVPPPLSTSGDQGKIFYLTGMPGSGFDFISIFLDFLHRIKRIRMEERILVPGHRISWKGKIPLTDPERDQDFRCDRGGPGVCPL